MYTLAIAALVVAAAYAGVILHVVFEDDTGADTPLPGGRLS